MDRSTFENWSAALEAVTSREPNPYRPLDFNRRVYLPDWDSVEESPTE